MQSLYKTIVVPEGDRYNNSDDNLILNTKIEIKDYSYTNRVGIVVEPPVHNPFELKKDDRILVHHNVFRKYWGFSTRLRTSSSDLNNGTFGVEPDQLFAKDSGSGWEMLYGNILVEPIEAPETTLILDLDVFIPRQGKVLYGAHKGSTIGFKPGREYEFRFDGMRVYKMHESDIICKMI